MLEQCQWFGFGSQLHSWQSTSCISRGLTKLSKPSRPKQELPAAAHLYHAPSPQTARAPLAPADCTEGPFISGPVSVKSEPNRRV